MLRHREAWAEEQRAPSYQEWLAREAAEESGEKGDERTARSAGNSSSNSVRGVGPTARTPSVERQAAAAAGQKPAASKELPMSNEVPKEVLVVVSKVKTYIRAKSQMNTSDAVTEALSELVRSTCDQAIEKAKSEGRKTVMARDITGAPSGTNE
jgi:histone H3/H4